MVLERIVSVKSVYAMKRPTIPDVGDVLVMHVVETSNELGWTTHSLNESAHIMRDEAIDFSEWCLKQKSTLQAIFPDAALECLSGSVL